MHLKIELFTLFQVLQLGLTHSLAIFHAFPIIWLIRIGILGQFQAKGDLLYSMHVLAEYSPTTADFGGLVLSFMATNCSAKPILLFILAIIERFLAN